MSDFTSNGSSSDAFNSRFTLNGERCDASAAERAVVRVWIGGETPLHFCAHHARKYEDAWVTAGYVIEGEYSLEPVVAPAPAMV